MNQPEYWMEHAPVAGLTSMKIGGTAQYLAKPRTLDELSETMRLVAELGLPYRIIGGGSNLILPDEEFAGVLIQPLFLHKKILKGDEEGEELLAAVRDFNPQLGVNQRYTLHKAEGFLNLKEEAGSGELDHASSAERVLIELGAGVAWGQAVMWSLDAGGTGLHWYARIPCQVGGAVFNNIHGEKHLLSESVVAVRAFDVEGGKEVLVPQAQAQFGYDTSLFHSRRTLIITGAIFSLSAGNAESIAAARAQYITWTKEKTRVQPAGNNCGSVFQNFSPDVVGEGKPVAAAHYIDAAGLKGYGVSHLSIFEGHANFILNRGGATAVEFIELLKYIRQTVVDSSGLWLLPEVECMSARGERLIWKTGEYEPSWEYV